MSEIEKERKEHAKKIFDKIRKGPFCDNEFKSCGYFFETTFDPAGVEVCYECDSYSLAQYHHLKRFYDCK